MMTESDKKRFNKRIVGEVLVSADICAGEAMTESAAQVNITEPSLYERISQYALLHGADLQGLFKTDRYLYMSCFIRDVVGFKAEFENEEMLKPLFIHDKGETAEFLISFPEEAINDDKEDAEDAFSYDIALEMVNEIIERNDEGRNLREKGKDGILTWNDNDTRDAGNWLSGYVKALEDNALITEEQSQTLRKKILSLISVTKKY